MTQSVNSILARDNLQLDMQSPVEPDTVGQYVEGWRMKLWDQAFRGDLIGKGHFKKGDTFKKFSGADNVIKRVVYRYGIVFFIEFYFIDIIMY